MDLKIGDFVKIIGKTVTVDNGVHIDPVGVLVDKWDNHLWQVLVFDKIFTIHSIRLYQLNR